MQIEFVLYWSNLKRTTVTRFKTIIGICDFRNKKVAYCHYNTFIKNKRNLTSVEWYKLIILNKNFTCRRYIFKRTSRSYGTDSSWSKRNGSGNETTNQIWSGPRISNVSWRIKWIVIRMSILCLLSFNLLRGFITSRLQFLYI